MCCRARSKVGKNLSRAIFLLEPSEFAGVLGVRGAVQRLTRFIDLGDRALQGLIDLRPELEFLERLRGEPHSKSLHGLPRMLLRAGGERPGVIFLKLIVTNLRRHRIRSLISVAGIALSVAAMLTVVTILQGAIGMFSSILSNDSQVIVFERDVSDLFFSNVPADALTEISSWPMVEHANPVLFGIVSSAGHPDHYMLWSHADDARIVKAAWTEGRSQQLCSTRG